MRTGLAVALALLAMVPALTACRRGVEDLQGYQVEVQVSPSPPRMGPAEVTVTLKDPSGRPVEGARVEVEGNMSHPGMVPVLGTGEEVAPGVYRVGLRFTMAGDWFLVVRADLPNGSHLEKTMDLPGVRP